jgi:tetratricopeptide (TPR) repeat protein
MSGKAVATLVILALGLGLNGCTNIQKSAPVADTPAKEEAGAAVPQAPDLPEVQLTGELLYTLMMGEIAGQRGNLDISVEHYLAAARETQDPRVAARAARIAVYARDEMSAYLAADMWVRFDPENIEARQMLAILLIRKGDTESALAHLSHILLSSKEMQDKNFFLIAGLLTREKDKKRALQVMQQLLESHADNAHAQYAYSSLAEQAGEYELASQAAQRALALNPGWPQATVQYARVLQHQGKTQQSLGIMKAAVDDHPRDVTLRLAYARLLVDAQQLKEARKEFAVLAEQVPDNPDILFALGILTMQAEDLDSAERYFLRLAKTGKRSSEAYFYLGQIAERQDQDLVASRWYSAVAQGEHYIDAQSRIAHLLARHGDIKAARQHLQETTVSNQVQRIRLLLTESDILSEAGQYPEAMTLLNESLAGDPQNTELLYARSLVAEKMNDIAQAERDLRSVLEREPDNAHALNALGYTLADRTSRYQEAYEYIKRALELRPQDPAIIDSMGWVLYRLGRYDEAVEHLSRALELSGDAEIAAHLGEVLWVKGDVEKARQVWGHALKSEPSHKLLNEVMKRFEQ